MVLSRPNRFRTSEEPGQKLAIGFYRQQRNEFSGAAPRECWCSHLVQIRPQFAVQDMGRIERESRACPTTPAPFARPGKDSPGLAFDVLKVEVRHTIGYLAVRRNDTPLRHTDIAQAHPPATLRQGTLPRRCHGPGHRVGTGANSVHDGALDCCPARDGCGTRPRSAVWPSAEALGVRVCRVYRGHGLSERSRLQAAAE